MRHRMSILTISPAIPPPVHPLLTHETTVMTAGVRGAVLTSEEKVERKSETIEGGHTMSNKCMLTLLVIAGLCAGPVLAQSLVPIDPATVSNGHVYLLEDETDSSPNGLTANLVGAPQFVAGLNGSAMQVNGSSDGLHIPDGV